MIFGSVVLLLAALLTVTGCSQATDSDGTTLVIGENHLFGHADQYAVERAVASAKATGRSLVISNGTWLIGTGVGLPDVSDFKDLSVWVEGSVTVSGNVIVNAARATLSFAEGATINVKDQSAFIYQGTDTNIGTDSGSPGYKVRYVIDPLLGTQGTDEHVAISDYTIGVNFANIAPHITTLYVLDKLTVNAGSIAAPGDGDVLTPGDNPRVIALGTVSLEASNSLVFQNLANFQFTDSAVLTSTAPSLTLTLNDLIVALPTINVALPLTIQGRTGGTTSLSIAKIEGSEPLTIVGDNSIGGLAITDVAAGARVAVSTPLLGTGGVTIGTNDGAINLGAPALTGDITAGANTGTLTIAAPINNVLVSVTKNSGTLNIDTGTIAGTYDYNNPPDTPTTFSGVFIGENTTTGEVNFVQSLEVTVDYGIRAPVNNGTINFYGTFATTSTALLGNGTAALFNHNIAGSGKLVFGGSATFGAATNIDSNTVFNAGFTQATNTALALGGDVTLANGQSITITAGASTSTTLKEGKKLLVGDVPVLAGGAPLATIAPPASTDDIVLIAGIRDPDDEDDLNYKTLALTTGGITSIIGDLRVTGLLFNEATINTGANGSLTLEDGAILLLPEVDNTVTSGNTVIAGTATAGGVGAYPTTDYTAPVQFVATGGAVSLGPDKISGSGASLVSPEDITGGPVISVGETTNGGTGLIIAGVNLDLQFGGELEILEGGTGTNYVTLEAGTNPGKITLSDDTSTTYGGSLGGNGIDTGGTADTFDAADIALSGTGVLLGDSETLPCVIGTISGAPNGRLTLTGLTTGSVSIGATAGTGIGNTVVGP
jgi:hypothetical protein